MSLCAIIPIKPLRRGKSRLSSVLSEDKREGLNQYLLSSTLQCLINRALRKASLAAKVINSSKILIVPADLPLITKDDILAVIKNSGNPPEIVIVPDRKMNGTNVLLVNPIGAIKYNFGDWSFRKHIEQAERKKINIKICERKNLSFDLDLPEDWEFLKTSMINNADFINQVIQEVKI